MCGRQTSRGHGQSVAAWPIAVKSNHLSLCRHCHPADGAFDSRDTASCDIEHQWQETIHYIIRLSSAQRHALVDWVAATKFKRRKLILGALSDFSRKLAPRKLPAIRYLIILCTLSKME